MIQDPYIPDKAKNMNEVMTALNSPFYCVCSPRKEGRYQHKLTWRKHGHNCDPNYLNISYAGESVVRKHMKRVFNLSLDKCAREPKAAIKAGLAYQAKIMKQEEEAAAKKAKKAEAKANPPVKLTAAQKRKAAAEARRKKAEAKKEALRLKKEEAKRKAAEKKAAVVAKKEASKQKRESKKAAPRTSHIKPQPAVKKPVKSPVSKPKNLPVPAQPALDPELLEIKKMLENF